MQMPAGVSEHNSLYLSVLCFLQNFLELVNNYYCSYHVGKYLHLS